MRIVPLLLAAAVHLAPADAGEPSLDNERLARIPTRMQQFVAEGKIAGAVILLTRHDEVLLLEAVGYQDLESKRPMRTDSIFRVASVAKPVTAIGVMILQEEGQLTIDDRLQRYLPEFRDVRLKDRATLPRPLTIRHLMTHTSGIARRRRQDFFDFLKKTLDDVVATYAQNPLDFEPGTKSVYSSEGFDTLGRVIEVVSGKSYEAFMEERVFGPLGMKDSGFFLSPEKSERLASFYRFENGELAESNEQSAQRLRLLQHVDRLFSAPAWGLHSTAPDLGALLQMTLNAGTHNGQRLLSSSTVKAMTMNQVPDALKTMRGLGWAVGQSRSPVVGRYYGHGGITGVSVQVFPEKDLASVFLTHQVDGESERVRRVFSAMVSAAIVD